jgi:hypothetical protein
LDLDIPSTILPLVSDETFDKESVLLTASSSLTLRTTSDEEITNSEQQLLPSIDTQPKVFIYFLVLFVIYQIFV